MEQIVIKIERKINAKVFWQEYTLEFQAGKSMFWWLKKISEELDPTLAFECSCNAGLCGACALSVDGRAVLSCKELVREAKLITVRPLHNLAVIKDLVIDWRQVDEKLRESSKWLFAEYELIINKYALDSVATALDKKLVACISCGICVAVCPVLSKGGFEYPFVFCKGHRLILDSNVPQELQQQVHADLSAKAPKCIGCGACDRSCPKGVQPSRSVAVFH